MERIRITCPETGHLEELELERTPAGRVISSCTRFQPRCALACSRECAKRMDRRDCSHVDNQDRILVVVAGKHALTQRIADALMDDLKHDGFAVERTVLESGATPPLADYDAVVIGTPARRGRYARPVIDYIRLQREALAAMPAFVFAVSDHDAPAPAAYVTLLTQTAGWRPTGQATFAKGMLRPEILVFARRIADEIPTAALQPNML